MPLAKDIAAELRRIADSLDREPGAQLTRPMLSFYNDTKAEFLASVRVLPRPIDKPKDSNRYTLELRRKDFPAVWTRSMIDREKVCKIIKPAQPAVYDCVPLLSEAEEASLLEA